MEREQLEKRKKLVYDLMGEELYVPMKEKELATFMQVLPEFRDDLRQVLDELLSEGKVRVTAKGKYIKCTNLAARDKEVLEGTFISHAKGFGFVEIEGRDEDLYIPEGKTGTAFHLDKVQVELLPPGNGKRQEAQVVRVVERNMNKVVGIYQPSKNFGFVIPDNTKLASDIFITKERSKGAVAGHKVVVEITDYGKEGKKPEGKIIEILGHVNDPGVDIMSIVRGYDLPVEFPEKVMNQVERIPGEISDADKAGRTDLRDVQMVTIDGEDAKDLDDAVSLSKKEIIIC